MRDRRCFLCLKGGHGASECNRSVQCRKIQETSPSVHLQCKQNTSRPQSSQE